MSDDRTIGHLGYPDDERAGDRRHLNLGPASRAHDDRHDKHDSDIAALREDLHRLSTDVHDLVVTLRDMVQPVIKDVVDPKDGFSARLLRMETGVRITVMVLGLVWGVTQVVIWRAVDAHNALVERFGELRGRVDVNTDRLNKSETDRSAIHSSLTDLDRIARQHVASDDDIHEKQGVR